MSRLAGWIASSVALLLVCSPGLTAQSLVSAADGAGPFTAWARHAWQPSDGMPDGPITAIVPLVDGSLLVAGKTGRCCLDGDRVWPLAAADPQCAKLDDVPLDPWLAAGRAAASPCTSRCRTADGTIFSGFLNGPPSRSRDGKTHRLGDALKNKKEPDGSSLFDHTTVVFGSNIRSVHYLDNCPTLIAGRGAGIRLGQHLVQPKDTPLCNVWLTLLKGSGIDVERFGN